MKKVHQKRTDILTIPLGTEHGAEHRKMIETCAAKSGMKTASWCRAILVDAAKKGEDREGRDFR